ncbi:GntR family transcriptional regulator [Nocardioides mangrovi]|uniref:GntR family transcriptional regulator n=1 Tax=Nocardioides mangrovi TaxID=2874580 RepID=A0ABS7UG37_9ACTN|nr:GntR family transcriptional regulator [Nocardioides mangrovi]MBZ5739656.1 GntR family transcriptional regulator [Nocardioides mangrovi]
MEVFPLDATSDIPPYEQLRAQVAARAASGDLPTGTRLPTVRALAADLGLAPNTVAKAYRALEEAGVVVTEGRRGTRVSGASSGARDAAAAFVATAHRLDLTLPEALRLVEESWPR